MSKSRPIRRPYLLLEVLIALMVVTLCAIPLARIQLNSAKKEVDLLAELQLSQYALALFGNIEELLYTHEIEWSNFSYRRTLKTHKKLPPTVQLKLAKGRKTEVDVTYCGRCVKNYRKSDRAIFRLISVDIEFDRLRSDGTKPLYHFTVFVEREEYDEKKHKAPVL